jgi:hypothetical protein
MGAWGITTFENDTAMDFLDILESSPEGEGSDEEPGRDALLIMTLMRAGHPEDGADADAATEGLAAAELIAAINGKPVEGLADTLESFEDLNTWIKSGKIAFRGKKQVAEMAHKAITRILTSELADLWAESDDNDAWLDTVKDLQKRLG